MSDIDPPTPGVYINEKNAFPPAIGEIPTAIPAFVGYTQKSEFKKQSLQNKPKLIASMRDFEAFYGGPPTPEYPIFEVQVPKGQNVPTTGAYDFQLMGKFYRLGAPTSNTHFYLHASMQFFFLNGGGQCYIVSVGNYTDPDPTMPDGPGIPHTARKSELLSGLDTLKEIGFPSPTLLLSPDALLLNQQDWMTVQQQMLAQAGERKDRFAILDIWEGYKQLSSTVISDFRNAIGTADLDYGAVYYPWLHTTIYDAASVVAANVASEGADTLITLEMLVPGKKDALAQLKKNGQALISILPDLQALAEAVAAKMNLLPPGPAMAGIYTQIDSSRGVWNAPANVNIDSVTAPAVLINEKQQEDLNVDVLAGKSVNAIRTFFGQGPAIVWGARTLDGNSLDWRYINVRRTMIMIEQSVRNAARQFVFQENDSNTWSAVKGSISGFLTTLWKEGALQGSTAASAFSVQVGLGATMTADDILNGIMRITVKVALIHPAEFIIITFEQQMATS